jgi:hypothetical protein
VRSPSSVSATPHLPLSLPLPMLLSPHRLSLVIQRPKNNSTSICACVGVGVLTC